MLYLPMEEMITSLYTLGWIVESGKNSNNSKKIILTNMIPNIKIKLNKHDKKPSIMNVLS